MYIVIGGDFVPTNSNVDLFTKGNVKGLIGEKLEHIITHASYRIFNLEVPLTDIETPIIKNGANMIAPTSSVQTYAALGIDLLTLANNHIMDQGKPGFESTIRTIDNAGIHYVGAGKNINEANAPYFFTFSEKKIAIYACAEHEFSIVTENTPGANPFDLLWSLDHVEELKKKSDYLIVLYHGGKERYRYPSPSLQKVCRRLVDKGADLVICQHSHCVGCEEKYKGGTIVYGQGNFLFDNSDNECWQTGLLIKINEKMDISYIPLVKTDNGVRTADEQVGNTILSGFYDRSEEIKSPDVIKKKYEEFAESYLLFYLKAFSGNHSLLFRIMNILTKGKIMEHYLQKNYQVLEMARLSNYIECEAHRELLLEALKISCR